MLELTLVLVGLLAGCGGEAIVSGRQNPLAMQLDESHAFWIEQGDFRSVKPGLFSVELEGGHAVTSLFTGEVDCCGLALDEAAVYFASAGRLMRVPKVGGPAVELAADAIVAIVVRGDMLVFLTALGGLEKMPAKGGPVTELAPIEYRGAGVISTSLVVDDDFAYWNRRPGKDLSEGMTLVRTPLAGGPTTTLATTRAARAIALGQEDLFASDGTTIWSVPKTGGDPTTVSLAAHAWAIALDDTFVYWADVQGDEIARAPRGGGEPKKIAGVPGGVHTPVAVEIHGSSVYWLNDSKDPKRGSFGEIRRLAR